MADSKITALTALTAADPINDMLPIVDVSDTTMAASGTTKKISVNNILGASGTATLASATITGDLTVDTSTLKVDSTNDRVGIGTASPNGPLDVQANSAATAISIRGRVSANVGTLRWFQNNGTTETAAMESYDTGFEFRTLTAVPSIFITNSSERYRIASDGVATWSNVVTAGTAMTLNSTGLGIGAVPSAYKLHVAGTGYFSSILTLGGASRISAEGSNALNLNTNSVDRLTIDSSGNVGIGVTPSAWTSYKALQINTISSIAGSTGSTDVGMNWIYKSGDKYIGNGLASSYIQYNGSHIWNTAANNVLGAEAALTWTPAMTLTAAGDLLVGKTTLESAERVSIATAAAANQCLYLRNTAAAQTGTLFVANTTTAATSLFSFADWYANGVAQFRVSGNGVVYAQNTVIQSISDLRLKENISNSTDGLDIVTALRPVRYDWKAGYGNDRKNQLGFIAQEIEAVFADAVGEWKLNGETYKTVGPSALIPVLVKAIQELTARVQTLEAR